MVTRIQDGGNQQVSGETYLSFLELLPPRARAATAFDSR